MLTLQLCPETRVEVTRSPDFEDLTVSIYACTFSVIVVAKRFHWEGRMFTMSGQDAFKQKQEAHMQFVI